ncbi:hypothetical protein GJ496_006868 [Pomphorhynchus laevis]|nr:hypothetical protein GJ496_006868 [Pomphorhynchus laevis]
MLKSSISIDIDNTDRDGQGFMFDTILTACHGDSNALWTWNYEKDCAQRVRRTKSKTDKDRRRFQGKIDFRSNGVKIEAEDDDTKKARFSSTFSNRQESIFASNVVTIDDALEMSLAKFSDVYKCDFIFYAYLRVPEVRKFLMWLANVAFWKQRLSRFKKIFPQYMRSTKTSNINRKSNIYMDAVEKYEGSLDELALCYARLLTGKSAKEFHHTIGNKNSVSCDFIELRTMEKLRPFLVYFLCTVFEVTEIENMRELVVSLFGSCENDVLLSSDFIQGIRPSITNQDLAYLNDTHIDRRRKQYTFPIDRLVRILQRKKQDEKSRNNKIELMQSIGIIGKHRITKTNSIHLMQ